MNKNNKTKKILLVDDQRGICDGLKIVLNNFGYDVETLTNGEEVLKTAKSYKPDLVLLDVFLAGVDGRDVLREFKNDDLLGSTPVILMSAQLNQNQLEKEISADGYLAKPFDLVTLKATLGEIMTKDKT